MSIRVIMRLTIREALRRKVILGLIILGVLYLVLYTLGLAFVHSEMHLPRGMSVNGAYNFMAIVGLYGVNFLLIMLSVLVSVDAIAGEIGSGTIQSIAVKPIRRYEIVLGKWLAFVILQGCSVLFLAGGVVLITFAVTGYLVPNALTGLGTIFLESLALLSVSLLGGTRLSTLANGVLGFGLFGLAFIGGGIQQIGDLTGSAAAVTVGQISSIIMPTEALWRLALAQMSNDSPIGLMFTVTTRPDPSIVLYVLAFIVVMLLLAIRSFQKRDL